MDKLTKEAIKKYDEEVNKIRRYIGKSDGPVQLFGYKSLKGTDIYTITDFGNIKKFWLKWLSKAFKAGVREGKAYQGRNKREWFQKGAEEGRKEAGKEFQKWWDSNETTDNIDSAMKRIFRLKDGGK